MKAVMLAAGVGRRLSGGESELPPKALLCFDGTTLLARHVAILRALGVERLVLVVGYREDDIRAEVQALGAGDFVAFVRNEQYRRGPMLSLWAAREALGAGDEVLFMDADVLYHPHLVGCLVESPSADCLIYDRGFDPGDEPVKLCLKDGAIVEFRKKVAVAYDSVGEWPGFLRLSPRLSKRLVEAMARYVEAGRLDEPYEEAMRDVMLREPKGTFRIEDVTGYPWIEIDFPSDLLRAEKDVLPRLRGVAVMPAAARTRDGVGS